MIMRIKYLIKKYCPEWVFKAARFFNLHINALISDIRNKPVSILFGVDRGTPVDRLYIENFLSKYSQYITGDVLEIAENDYTLKYAHDLKKSHILHVTADNPNATLVGNLETGENIPENQFDCLIITQTLAFIYDIKSVVKNCHKALKPGGCLLLTNPSITPISMYDMERWGDFWRFTTLSMQRLLEESFLPENIKVESFGNYYAAKAFLAGKAVEELNKKKLLQFQGMYTVTIAAAAIKHQ